MLCVYAGSLFVNSMISMHPNNVAWYSPIPSLHGKVKKKNSTSRDSQNSHDPHDGGVDGHQVRLHLLQHDAEDGEEHDADVQLVPPKVIFLLISSLLSLFIFDLCENYHLQLN